nr:glycoside hydrolase family 97 protein [Sphingomonas insulae]
MIASSPDGQVEIMAGRFRGGSLAIRIRHHGKDVIAPSPVGLTLADEPLKRMRIEQSRRPGDRSAQAYHELTIAARETEGSRRALLLHLRAYDTGAAFRIELPRTGSLHALRLAGETTALRFPRDYRCLAVPHDKYLNSHEGDYAPVRASTLRPAALYDLPLSCRTGQRNEAIALTESDVENYPGAYLVKSKALGVAFRLTPLPANDTLAAVLPATDAALRTPWRVVMIADRPERLIENELVQQLASPPRIGEAQWVRPGKAAWAWWSGIKAYGVPNAGFNNPTYQHYVDFASRFGLPYFVIDWGWAARPRGDKALADVTRFRSGVDIPALSRYAAARGVRLWLWTNWDAIGPDMDRVFALYQSWGIAGIKVDYVYRQDQVAIAYYHRLLAAAARHRLMVNIHGAPVPRGLEHTYPNLLTQEGVMGAEYNKWSRKVTAGANVRLAYSRATIGPMDYTPGGFRNVTSKAFKPRHVLPEVMTTRAQQLAMFVVYPSPLQSLADAPQAYLDQQGRPQAGANFLRLVPAVWDETRGVAGEWGQWIAVARRSGKRWFVGVMNDERSRTVTLPLGFLSEGRWKLHALIDGARPPILDGRGGTLRAGTSLRVPLAASGGAVLVLDPEGS